jgi:hypothetical protein
MIELIPGRGRITDYGRHRMMEPVRLLVPDFSGVYEQIAAKILRGAMPPIAGGASASDYAEKKLLEHLVGKSSWAMPTFYLALCTAVPTDASTGATITEATYTGYGRKKVEGTEWAEATGPSPYIIKNNGTVTFAECTSGSSTIKGWAGCDASGTGAGNVLAWGPMTEVTIDTTPTPASLAASKLEISAD